MVPNERLETGASTRGLPGWVLAVAFESPSRARLRPRRLASRMTRVRLSWWSSGGSRPRAGRRPSSPWSLSFNPHTVVPRRRRRHQRPGWRTARPPLGRYDAWAADQIRAPSPADPAPPRQPLDELVVGHHSPDGSPWSSLRAEDRLQRSATELTRQRVHRPLARCRHRPAVSGHSTSPSHPTR